MQAGEIDSEAISFFLSAKPTIESAHLCLYR